MANGRTHRRVGTVAGAAAAAISARNERQLDAVLETLGGALGGRFGAMLPDIFEPATSPHHRAIAHSATFGVGVPGAMHAGPRRPAVKRLRERADHHLALAKDQNRPFLLRVLDAILYAIFRVGAGACSGVPIGYLSHLALDATTPRCLPLFA